MKFKTAKELNDKIKDIIRNTEFLNSDYRRLYVEPHRGTEEYYDATKVKTIYEDWWDENFRDVIHPIKMSDRFDDKHKWDKHPNSKDKFYKWMEDVNEYCKSSGVYVREVTSEELEYVTAFGSRNNFYIAICDVNKNLRLANLNPSGDPFKVNESNFRKVTRK